MLYVLFVGSVSHPEKKTVGGKRGGYLGGSAYTVVLILAEGRGLFKILVLLAFEERHIMLKDLQCMVLKLLTKHVTDYRYFRTTKLNIHLLRILIILFLLLLFSRKLFLVCMIFLKHSTDIITT